MPGKVTRIIIGPEKGEPLECIEEAEIVAGKGIKGDRNWGFDPAKFPKKDPTGRQVTLIEAENIALCNEMNGSDFPPEAFRRNIVTEGIALNDLVGKTFTIGTTTLEGKRLCHPCKYLQDMLGIDVMRGLKDKGGLRADIVESGTIKLDDTLIL